MEYVGMFFLPLDHFSIKASKKLLITYLVHIV